MKSRIGEFAHATHGALLYHVSNLNRLANCLVIGSELADLRNMPGQAGLAVCTRRCTDGDQSPGVPNVGEHRYLTVQLTPLGYEQVSGSGWQRHGELFRFDLFSGNRIHTTELLESPLLEGRNRALARYSRLYVGILNDDDLIASKLMRGTQVDFEDCVMLFEAHRGEIDIERLREHFRGLIQYDVNQERLRPHFDHFQRLLEEKGLS